MSKPFAAFDVDGTIFKSSILEKTAECCIRGDVFEEDDNFQKVWDMRRQWQVDNNEEVYQEYLQRLVGAFIGQIAGVEVERFREVAKVAANEHGPRMFAFPRQLIGRLQESHHIVALSGSPRMLVETFLERLDEGRDEESNVDFVYGSEYEERNGMFTGNATSIKKDAILRDLVERGEVKQEGSVAIGDTIGDEPALAYADTPMMFNPSLTLRERGREGKWLWVQEIKDQIAVMRYNANLDRYQEMSETEFEGLISGLKARRNSKF